MKRTVTYFFSIFFLLQVSLQSYSSNPKDFVYELVNDAINHLSNKDLSKEEKVLLIEKIALENVDIKALSLYTLGELRKSADKDSLENYQKSFEKYFLKTLTSRLKDYSTSKFEILSEDKKSANYTIIKSKIKSGE